ncbi:alpha/beta hydrolase [Burkholderia multivorans]|uniref:alpha/beta hydrolase n=1 Tax=Burkholderia multivorans TaxID=87883 RepID=UPI000D00D573|nr:alpha/beta hydrolase [Burkholderia multivorans]MBU9231770.1 alpha/beta hydrolase [Burkholderia multivorans]MCA8318437.1 alpha/beta hydrolase [Burkholderia multivorans]MDN7479075.1 alpha/beta hydrolase [Burkholderia multivorans]MDN7862103.1 alpha/beta hydrolase [Burkholderia multivorans]PRE00351.1 lipase [Burkholderia multivorans]
MTKPALRPDVQALLAYLHEAKFPEVHTQTPDQVRASMLAAVPLTDLDVPDMAVRRRLSIPRTEGDGDIPALLLDTKADRGPGPVVIWFHGGGYVSGSIETHQSFAATVSRQLELPVVLVDYRLAPEAPYPAAVQDAEACARWIAASPDALGLKVSSLILGGDSAGGTLTAVTAIALRDAQAAVPVRCQILFYPATDFTREFASHGEFAEGYLLTRAGRRWYQEQYRPQKEEVQASPLRADLAGLPPAVVLIAGVDPVRDEGRAYAAKLIEAGVPTTFLEAKGMIHAFVLLRKALPSVNDDIDRALLAARIMWQQPLSSEQRVTDKLGSA